MTPGARTTHMFRCNDSRSMRIVQSPFCAENRNGLRRPGVRPAGRVGRADERHDHRLVRRTRLVRRVDNPDATVELDGAEEQLALGCVEPELGLLHHGVLANDAHHASCSRGELDRQEDAVAFAAVGREGDHFAVAGDSWRASKRGESRTAAGNRARRPQRVVEEQDRVGGVESAHDDAAVVRHRRPRLRGVHAEFVLHTHVRRIGRVLHHGAEKARGDGANCIEHDLRHADFAGIAHAVLVPRLRGTPVLEHPVRVDRWKLVEDLVR